MQQKKVQDNLQNVLKKQLELKELKQLNYKMNRKKINKINKQLL